MVVSSVKGRARGHKPLARSLAVIKELLYDADDVVDELDYWRLQQHLQGGRHYPGAADGSQKARRADRSRKIADIANNSVESDAASNAAPIAIATTDNLSSTKRRRVDKSARLMTADTSAWNKDEFSKRIQEITRQLQDIRGDVKDVLMILGSDSCGSSSHYRNTMSHPHVGTSSLIRGKVYGRVVEKKSIVNLIKEHKSSSSVTVLPVVGIGGIGKTTLAQLVYHDPSLDSQFDHRIWISVSNNFDEMRVSKQMLDFVSQERHESLCSFANIQEVLKGHIKSKRVLLILDDVWDGMNDCQWNQLIAPLKSDNANGNVIILTTRKPSVAEIRGTAEPIKLKAMEKDDFWLLFKACACGDENYELEASLRELGLKMAEKLKGNPLAAETAGALLREHLTVNHWRSVLKNEDWKSLHLSSGIMPSLKLCYDLLPYHLQQCFSYCSIFPCHYSFLPEELVRIWISQGFVKGNHSSMSLEEKGLKCLTDLVNLGFFEVFSSQAYIVCDLMHDLARVVSSTECTTIDGLQFNEILPTVHHLSVLTNYVYKREGRTWNIHRSENFEEILRNTATSVRKLRTLVLIGEYDNFFFQSFQHVFQKAHNLRLLQMSATSSDFYSFIGRLVNPAHLRYLKLDGSVEQCYSPQVKVTSKFSNLQVLDVGSYNYFTMRHRHSFLPTLRELYLDDCLSGEWQILPSFEILPFLKKLKLSNMGKVREVSIPSLEELVLDRMPGLERCSCTSLGGLKSSLRLLEINSCTALKVFDLFEENHSFESEQNSWLPSLRKLIIQECCHLHIMIPFPLSSNLCELFIRGLSTLPMLKGSSSGTLTISENNIGRASSDEAVTLDHKSLAFHNLRDLKYLNISNWTKLASISLDVFSQLVSLKGLTIERCKNVFSFDVLPLGTHEEAVPANCNALACLRSLSIRSCGIIGKWLSLMLQHSPKLQEFCLDGCPQFTKLQIEEKKNSQSNPISDSDASSSGYRDNVLRSSAPDGLLRIPLNLTSSLTKIAIFGCAHLTFNGSSFAGFTSLQELRIFRCPMLLSSLVNDDGKDGRWLLPQSLDHFVIGAYSQENLQPCFLGNMTRLKQLEICLSTSLECLQLRSCTALEDLSIVQCNSLTSLEGLHSLRNLKKMALYEVPGLPPCLERLSSEGCQLCPRLESLEIDDLSLLNMPFCKGLTTLQSLELSGLVKETRLTDEQQGALLLLRSLQELRFFQCWDLGHLPAGLHNISSLKMLMIFNCPGISRLPKGGRPHSLEELEIEGCSWELTEQCRLLATSKLMVKLGTM